VLVITYWRFADPLIQTYTLPYVRLIRQQIGPAGRITLFTLEPESQTPAQFEAATKGLAAEDIEWQHIRYERFNIRMLLRLMGGLWALWLYVLRAPVDVIHGWCTPGGALALWLSWLTGRPLVLDSCEPHADCMAEGKEWAPSGLKYRILMAHERWMVRRAKAIIACVPQMREYIRQRWAYTVPETKPLFVKPACVDHAQFRPREPEAALREALGISPNDIVLIYAGKFTGLYLEEESFLFMRACAEHWGDRFRVLLLTSHSREEIEAYCQMAGFDPARVIQRFVPHAEVPRYMALGTFGLSPYKPIPSRRFGAPIKTSEYWAMGLPVAITPDSANDSQTIADQGFGVVFDPYNPDSIRQSIVQLDSLLNSGALPALRQRIIEHSLRNRSYEVARVTYQQLYSPGGLLDF
jgi:glycosyltransferase involved in cell wall biosynthesis